jgi:hypothetical protein
MQIKSFVAYLTMLSNYWMNNELEKMWKEAVDDICLEGLRKTTKNVRQDSQCPIPNPNQAPT